MPKPTPIFRLEPRTRRRTLETFVGYAVVVDVDFFRDGDVKRYPGIVVAVAAPLTGAVVDSLIIAPYRDDLAILGEPEGCIDYDPARAVCISAATIRSVTAIDRPRLAGIQREQAAHRAQPAAAKAAGQ